MIGHFERFEVTKNRPESAQMSPSHHGNRNTAQAFPAARASCCVSGQSDTILTLHTLAPISAPFGGGAEVRIHPVMSLFAASLVTFLPMHAVAQTADSSGVSVRERERPELDPLGARLGAFQLNAALDFDVTSTDNLFATSTGEVDDIIYTVSPSARLASGWSRHSLALEAGAAWRSHEDFSSEDVDTHYVRGVGRFDIGSDTAIHGSARYAHEFTPRYDPESLTGSPTEYDRTDASLGISHRFARMGVRLDAFTAEREYDAGATARDYEENGIRGRLDVEVSPRVSMFLRGVVDERDYANSPASNSEGTAVLVGAAFNGDLFRGEISAGQFEREYEGFDTIDGLAVSGRVEWSITPLTTITVDAQRSADDNIGVASGLPYVTTEYGARVDHELLRNVILTAAARAGDRDYEDAAREDEYVRYEVGADYILNRRVALRARYYRDDVESSEPARNFDVDAFTVGVSLRL